MSVIPAQTSPQLASVLRFLQGWRDVDLSPIVEELAEEPTYHLHPQSLDCPPLRSKEEIIGFFDVTFIMRTEKYTSEVVDVIENADSSRIVIHEKCETTSVMGSVFKNEYIWIFTMEPARDAQSTPKIAVVKIFMDSRAISDFFTSEDDDEEAER